MCTGVEIAAVVGATAALYTATRPQPKNPELPAQPGIPAPTVTPDITAVKARQKAIFGADGPFSGADSTFLTGPGGVPSSGTNLGKNTLLGS